MHLLQNDIQAAQRRPSVSSILQPTSIPYARYTIFVCLANIELAVAQKDFDLALTLSQELLAEVTPLTRVDIPEVLRYKASALIGLGRSDEAHQALTEACQPGKRHRIQAACFGSSYRIWRMFHAKLGHPEEAEANRRRSVEDS